jgi:integral membrane protein
VTGSGITQRHFGSPASHLRSVAFLEGLSYVVLLFVAVPLKYLGDLPIAVRVVGPVHGTLFVWLGLLVVGGLTSRDRSMGWGIRIMVAALLPFGIFVIDRGLRAEMNDKGRETVSGGRLTTNKWP